MSDPRAPEATSVLHPGAAAGRADPTTLDGLDGTAVLARVEAGQVNTVAARPSRTVGEILRANLLTRFNAILGGLFVVVVFVGPPQDGLFGVVLALNAAIGVVQEVRSKRALDRLAVLSAPIAHVVRDGKVAEHPMQDVVLDDLLELRPGDEVVADAEIVRAAGLQLDESLLTGESVAVDKQPGDEVLSGSIVVSGSGYARVARVGADAFAQRIQVAAKRFAAARSELQEGTNRILRLVSWILPPAGALLVTSQLLRSHLHWREALRGSVAGIGAMVPEGLVLLTTVAFALGALRLARRRVLVQALPAIEGLARVDVVCIDKTGTLTEPGMTFDHAVDLSGDLAAALGALGACDPAPNATMQAILAEYPPPAASVADATIPFSSERKWSAAQFAGPTTLVLGAPDVVFSGRSDARLDQALGAEGGGAGKRLLVLARSGEALAEASLPGDLVALGLVVLAERLRPDAADTVRYLVDQGITLKVISGDHAESVAATAARAGIGVGTPRDARTLPDDPVALGEAVEEASVFGRVRPDQKREIVAALQARGHVVAMTGDGVNDVPALKQADVGIAMGSGSQASRAVANLVLLDNAFASVPPVLVEGRRVIGNIERVANLFVTKTVYAALLAVVVGVLAAPYPFYPRQLTVVSSLTIGIPGFFLALAPESPRAQPRFLRRVARFTVPAGVGVATATLAVYTLARWPQHASTPSSKAAAAAALFVVAVVVLALLARPLQPWRVVLVASMAGGGVLAMLVPISRRVFSFSVPPASLLLTVALVTVPVVVVVLAALWRATGPAAGAPREARSRSRPRAAGCARSDRPRPPGHGG